MEAVRIRNKTSEHVADQFSNCWLSKYPKPVNCIYDNGGKFIGKAFRNLLYQAGIKKKTCTVKNPQSNAVCERMHSTMGSILRAETAKIQYEDEAAQAIINALQTCMHDMRCAVNRTLQTSPGPLVFNRDMMMDVPLIADLN